MKKINKLIMIIVALFLGCISKNDNIKNRVYIINPPIDSLKKWALKDIGFDNIDGAEVIKINKDTLKIISTAKFIYYPLGQFSNIQSLELKYPILKIEKSSDNEMEELFKTSYKHSSFKFVLDKETNYLEIVFARILDEDIKFKNGIQVGMDIDSLYCKIFSKPIKLDQVKKIKIISALDGINHLYELNNGKIDQIIIDSDYLYNKN